MPVRVPPSIQKKETFARFPFSGDHVTRSAERSLFPLSFPEVRLFKTRSRLYTPPSSRQGADFRLWTVSDLEKKQHTENLVMWRRATMLTEETKSRGLGRCWRHVTRTGRRCCGHVNRTGCCRPSTFGPIALPCVQCSIVISTKCPPQLLHAPSERRAHSGEENAQSCQSGELGFGGAVVKCVFW